MSLAELTWNLAVLLALACVGRVVLAFLPAGQPGRHGLAELPSTWAACHLLGLAALQLELSLLARTHIDPNAWTVFLPWVLLAIVRVESLPAAMVPRHEPRAEAPGDAATILLGATVLAVLVAGRHAAAIDRGIAPDATGMSHLLRSLGAGRESAGLADTASYGAILALVARGLATARRAPLERRILVLALACTPLLFASASGPGPSMHPGLFVAAAGAFGVARLRRADLRGGALALVALLALPLFDPSLAWLALAGGASLVAADPAVSAKKAAARAAAVVLAGTGVLLAVGSPVGGGPFAGLAGLFGPFAPWRIWWLGALAAAGVGIARAASDRKRGEREGHAIEPPARELLFLGLFLVTGLVAAGIAGPSEWRGEPAPGLVALLPAAALFAGLAFVRTETPGGAA